MLLEVARHHFGDPEFPWRVLMNLWPVVMVRTFAKRAVGSQTGSGGFDDAYAYLPGFAPDQTAQATLWKDPAIGNDSITCKILWRVVGPRLRGHYCDGSGTHEVELLLRWSDS